MDRNFPGGTGPGPGGLVALRKESVDRNNRVVFQLCSVPVALRKESVDRNSIGQESFRAFTSRSPQGERG